MVSFHSLKNLRLAWNLLSSVSFLKTYFSYLNLTLCTNKGRKALTWLFPTSKITWCIVIQMLKLLHNQSLFKTQPTVSIRYSFWVQKKQRGTKVYENGSIAKMFVLTHFCQQAFQDFSVRSQEHICCLHWVNYGEIPPQHLFYYVLSTVYVFV